ncbi:hypothetical protein HK104_007228, partial [Borealophlyctis nickersoniae]
MVEEGNLKVADLAKESRHTEKHLRIPRIPLMVLAPLLVVAALIATLVPNTIILQQASQDTTQVLSDVYLDSMMEKVVQQSKASFEKMTPGLQSLMDQQTTKHLATNLNNLINEDVMIENMIILYQRYNTGTVTCFTGRWAPGFGEGSTPNMTTVDGTVVMVAPNPSAKTPAEFQIPVIGIVEDTVNKSVLRAYPANPVTRKLFTTDTSKSVFNATKYDLSGFLTVRAQLSNSLFPPRREPVMTVTKDHFNITFAAMFLLGWNNASSPTPDFGCANKLLYEARPTPDSVITIFSQKNFSIIATSGKFSTDLVVDPVTGFTKYAAVDTDELTVLVQSSIRRRYGGVFNPTTLSSDRTYEEELKGGEPWIVNVRIISFGVYDDGKVVLVSALPRKDIFGQIDAARKRSIAGS